MSSSSLCYYILHGVTANHDSSSLGLSCQFKVLLALAAMSNVECIIQTLRCSTGMHAMHFAIIEVAN